MHSITEGGEGLKEGFFGLEGSYSSKGAPPASRKGGGSPGNSPPCGRLLQLERGASSLAEGGGLPGTLLLVRVARDGRGALQGHREGLLLLCQGRRGEGPFPGGGAGPSPGGGGSTLTRFADSISKFNILG